MAHTRLRLLLAVILVFILTCLLAPFLGNLYLLLRLPFVWKASSAAAIITPEHDGFDLSFAAYNRTYSTADAGLPTLIPARLHHVHLGPEPLRQEWQAARDACLAQHPNWEAFLWDDRNASHFVQNHYPHLLPTWESYPHLVQRVDALRYMILHTYGGAILDFDLACKRSLEPLRQFEFVAPAANPVGISIGMMLAAPNNSYVGDLVRNLPNFNRRWSLLPYITVMFSTGCHYASTIYTMERTTSHLRILTGPPDNPKLHMLNGIVDTPLFRHLGSSSWHQKDARLIKAFANMDQRLAFGMVLVVLVGVVGALVLCVSRVRSCRVRKRMEEGEKFA
ncbi:glycosyltransferase family 32 protein [Aspergillus ibericus CBS 121593]|uniref:Glycosyl transferase n=1 Tax=Aspergillus ibericus CBS 121593 TaxID=1448316 RepID=A0A395GHS2_9EURO|nr:glycosyl transferase [Aspergillus ibericus CBS 121593]RAK94975.1 glycosyl transferase [Aspergillus ibericus CBS 121593]